MAKLTVGRENSDTIDIEDHGSGRPVVLIRRLPRDRGGSSRGDAGMVVT